MFLTLGVLTGLAVIVILAKVRTRVGATALGSMSERWLAEYRASNPW